MSVGIIASSGTAINRADLAGLLPEYAMSMDVACIGLKILPDLLLPVKNGYFKRLKRSTLMQRPDPNAVRASQAEYPRIGYEVYDDSYVTKEYGLEAAIGDDEQKAYSNQFDAELTAAQLITLHLMHMHEARVYSLINNTTTYPLSGDTGLTVSTKWDVTATVNIYDDITTGALAIQKYTGKMRKELSLLVHEACYAKMCSNKHLRETIGIRYDPSIQTTAYLDTAKVAAALGIKEVIVDGETYNSAKENATISVSNYWTSTRAFLGALSSGANPLNELCLGRTVAWAEDGGLFSAETYREDKRRANVARVRQAVTEKLFESKCGYLFDGVL